MADTKALFTQRFDAARAALAKGDQPAAAESLHWAIVMARSDPALRRELASALFNLGLLLVEKHGDKEAFDLFEKVVEREPRNAWAHYELGAIHERLGREGKAVDSYARAFALDPQLALPDVNPHVIDSKLTTEAMLRAYSWTLTQAIRAVLASRRALARGLREATAPALAARLQQRTACR